MTTMIQLSSDQSLRARALRVVPGGMYGHLAAKSLPAAYPQFFRRGAGSRIWDADGRSYIDLMCSWGPIVLGHGHPAVEAAADRRRALGDCLNGPTADFVELAERLVARVTHADWAMFAKNGTDATTMAVTIARGGTGRRKILVARGAYHGAAPWCTPSLVGVTAEDRAHILHFDYNDVASLEAAGEQARGDLAAILVSAFKHDIGRVQALPDPHFARRARELATEADAALIVDDVRAGFRLAPGGSWDTVGVQPDLAAWSKAIANGHPLAALTGNDRFRQAASEIFVTGSFWMGASAMAAAIATLEALEAQDAIAHMVRLGERLRHGIDQQAARHGVRVIQSGPVQMPSILFDDDPGHAKGACFVSETLKRGIYLHHRHNMFLSAALVEADIDEILAATDAALAVVATWRPER